ncbi:MAG TPA: VLRF1 family aeRF1-type release factor [Solirubrobacterales bacterium]|nr:VLRF1 family aeRF1-type release factor [Solirubrobacterales bacterium]
MAHPTYEDARKLVEWLPRHGVVSVYLGFDPADRGGAWRTELRNALAQMLEATNGADHERRVALKATAERVARRFANHDRSLPRGEVGFVEVSADGGAEHWWTPHQAPEADICACFAERAVVSPLLYLSEHGCPRGVALLSAERVRLFEWAPGHLEEVDNLELSVYSGDWRERKAQRVSDPARGQAVSASGRDRFDERLAGSRERFLVECGRLGARQGDQRHWQQIDIFGVANLARSFRQGASSVSALPVEVAGDVDLISVEDEGQLEERIEEGARRVALERDRALIEHALDEARGGTRGAAGQQETLAALEEGRVSHLIVDAAHTGAACSRPVMAAEAPPQNGVVQLEPLAGRALLSSAKISTVVDGAAELLADAGGVAALLRY